MSILQSLLKIEEIPSLPLIIVQIRRVIESGSSDAKELSDVIEHDPALASKVLHAVNSAYFTPASKRVSSIQNAVVRLGFKTVQDIALTIGLVRLFPQGSSEALNHTMFWRHSVAAAYLAEEIASHSSRPAAMNSRDLPFTCGLLHDIGIILVDQFLHDTFVEIMRCSKERDISFCKAEVAVVQNESHDFIGGAILEWWKMESAVVSAVRFHHRPLKAPEPFRFLASIVYLCEYVLCNTRIGSIEGKFEDASIPEICSFVGIEGALLPSLLADSERHKYPL